MRKLISLYRRGLRGLVIALAVLSGGAISGMMLVTCADVVARRGFGRPLRGAYDIVCLLALVAIVGALPYTTAVKGHVAVEFFFNKLPLAGRLVIDAGMRLMSMALFFLLSHQSLVTAARLRARGEVMLTLNIGSYWAPVCMAIAFAVTALVIGEQLLRPEKAVMTP